MSFERLSRADAVAMVAALVLLFVMATDWWSTNQGDAARQDQKISGTSSQSPAADEATDESERAARDFAETQEQNAWQQSAFVDRLILLGLLATIAAALAAAFLRAADRRFEPPRSPSTAIAVAGTVTALLIVYRIVQKPGVDAAAVVKAGPPLALLVLAVMIVAARFAIRSEEDGSAWATTVSRSPLSAD